MRMDRRPAVDFMNQELNNVLSRFFGGGLWRDGGEQGYGSLAQLGVDIREDADNIYVEADLPGFRKEDVDITLENGMLTISAERREPEGEPEGARGGERSSDKRGKQKERGNGTNANYLLQERRYQRFVRSFTLPPNVQEQDVQARLDNGVLEITLRKRAEAKPRRIALS